MNLKGIINILITPPPPHLYQYSITYNIYIGHEDYGFSVDWSPNGLEVATGN